jgi:hypothetical protein
VLSSPQRPTVPSGTNSYYSLVKIRPYYLTLSSYIGIDIGSYIKLSPDYTLYEDASKGPLRIGDFAIVEENDKSDKPFRVRAVTGIYIGASWWYKAEAIVKVQAATEAELNAPTPALKFSYGYPNISNGYNLPLMLPKYAGGDFVGSNHSIQPILGLDMSCLSGLGSQAGVASAASAAAADPGNVVYLPCLVMLPFIMNPVPATAEQKVILVLLQMTPQFMFFNVLKFFLTE